MWEAGRWEQSAVMGHGEEKGDELPMETRIQDAKRSEDAFAIAWLRYFRGDRE